MLGAVGAVLGEYPDRTVERCLQQVKTPEEYIEELSRLGLHPELQDPTVRQLVINDIRWHAERHPFSQWILVSERCSFPSWVTPYARRYYQLGKQVELNIRPHALFAHLAEDREGITEIISLFEEEARMEQEG